MLCVLVLIILSEVSGVVLTLTLRIVALTAVTLLTVLAAVAAIASAITALGWAIAIVLRGRNVALPNLRSSPGRNVGPAGGDIVSG